MTNDEILASWRGARVRVVFSDGFAVDGIAAFVFEAPGGLAYIGPGYRDDWGADRAAHRIEGAVTVSADRAEVTGAALRVELTPIGDEEGGRAGQAIYELDESLRAAGLTWSDERERLRAASLSS